MDIKRFEVLFGDKNIIIETGKIAKQANAAVTVTCGGTVVLVAVCMAKKVKDATDFFPLMVEYQEKTYSAGRIPGGFFKREGRPTQKEILTSRIIDRPLRPLFPEGFFNDVVITCTVLSSDGENDPDMLSVIGASAALTISDIPFNGPVGALRIGITQDSYLINPTYAQRAECIANLIVVGVENGIVMIEGEVSILPEERIIDALKYASTEMQVIRKLQVEMGEKIGKPKADVQLFNPNPALKKKIKDIALDKITEVYNSVNDKLKREEALSSILDGILSDMTVFEEFKMNDKEVSAADIRLMFDFVEYEVVRKSIFEQNKRADGRSLKEIRNISCEVDVLPRTHGSSLFTRGQTQSLAVVTLGTRRDEQLEEALDGVRYNNFMLHYNFPAFSVGEAKGSRGPGRREIGHGALACKALTPVLPGKEDFPYTIRVVSEILESNGSSSMASVCAGCLSLMAAGVPIKNAVAGISIGLVLGENNKYALLSDIMGLEDHFGDMDFKIAGTKDGITAIQLDLKVAGVSLDVLAEGIYQAKEARLHILEEMQKVISKPKEEISEFAPHIVTTMVPQEKIGEVIGPGGKTIKKIIEETGVESIDIEEDGKVLISGINKEATDKALAYVNGMVAEAEVGKIYDATAVKIMNFGVFVEFMPGKQGLVHVSELSTEYVKDVESCVKVGDKFKVKVVEIDKQGRINLSKKQAEQAQD